jgi:hypothetical protein
VLSRPRPCSCSDIFLGPSCPAGWGPAPGSSHRSRRSGRSSRRLRLIRPSRVPSSLGASSLRSTMSAWRSSRPARWPRAAPWRGSVLQPLAEVPRSAAPSWRGRWRPSRRAHRPGRAASPACPGRSRRPRRRRACLGANATRVLDVDMCGGLRVGPEAGSESARTASRRALREKAELIPSKPGSRARWGSQTLILPVRRETFRATNSGAYPRMALPRERPPQRRHRTTPLL